jgi:hypothetical protein
MKKPEDLFEHMHRLLKEIHALRKSGSLLAEGTSPTNIKSVIHKTEKLADTWNTVYTKFRVLRAKLRDIFSTYGMQTLPKRGKYAKSTSDIRQVSEGLLAENLKWTASRFVSEYENHVSKQFPSLKLRIEDVESAADVAKSLGDENLRSMVEELNEAYLPFDLAVSDQLFGSLTNIIRSVEAIVDKHLPPEQRLERLPREGKGRGKYKAEKIQRLEKIEANAKDAAISLGGIESNTMGTRAEITDIVSSAFSMTPPDKRVAAEEEEDPSMEPREVPDPTIQRQRRTWIKLNWLDDPEITTEIKL